MRNQHVMQFAVGCAVFVGSALSLEAIRGREEKEKITVADLNMRIEIVGRLGMPLGRCATLRGEWVEKKPRDKPLPQGTHQKPEVGPWFLITHIDGEKKSQTLAFRRPYIRWVGEKKDEPKPVIGAVWDIRGYEWLVVFGTISWDAEKEMGIPPTSAARKTYETDLLFYRRTTIE